MSVIVGSGEYTYEALDGWEQLPDGVRLVECPGVAVDSQDRVYVLTRNPDHPVQVFDREGSWLTSFGQGVFSERTHGLFIGPDESVYAADDGTHTITKFTTEGELVMTLGERYAPSEKWKGAPFNRPTHAAVSPNTGEIYVSDGYGNSRIHKYTPDGRLLLSWGEPGIDPGQFIRPHNIAVDGNDRVLVADRECHRVQVFDAQGGFLTMWSNIHRPDGMVIGPDGNVYIGELNGIPGVDDAPRPGAQGEHPEPGGRTAGADRRPGGGRGAGEIHRPSRNSRRLSRGYLRGRGGFHDTRQSHGPAARAQEPEEASQDGIE